VIEDSRILIPQIMGTSSSRAFEFKSIYDVKQLATKVLKTLREELAQANTISIKLINADLIDLESNHRHTTEVLKRLSTDALVREIHSLKQEVLGLKLNEVFMKKCSDQSLSI
jgi:hypothetical protein